MIRTWISRWARDAVRGPSGGRTAPIRRSNLRMEHLEDRAVPALLDLTGGIGLSGALNGAVYSSVDPHPTGTGVIDPFVRVQKSPSSPSGMEHGYNTDGIEEFDTKDAGGHNWDHSLALANLKDVNGYYQFTLDVNETKPGAYISLDELQVFVQNAPDLTGAAFNAAGTITSWQQPSGKSSKTVAANLVYDLDGNHVKPAGSSPNGDSSVLLNYFLNHGSGSGDMTVLIPKALFPAIKGQQQYVYLYSKFGQDVAGAGAEAGFEEWTALVGAAPPVGPFSLSGHKYEDMNGDGNVVGDPGLPGWEINLYREADGQTGLTAGDAFLGSKLTGPDGSYSFTDLPAGGTYYTTESAQPGWIQTYGGNTENGAYDYYTTYLNGDVIDIDFGNFERFDLSGVKFRDVNKDGVKDANEPLLSGWTIFLDGSNGGTVNGVLDPGEKSTVTGPGGAYSFTDLGPGTYVVREVQKPNWQQYTANPAAITGVSGVDVTGVDFGNAMINPGSGHTKGYWHNQNGADTIAQMGGWDVVKYELANLYLRNEDGTLFDPVHRTLAEFQDWITFGSNASNMVNQLSAQAAASYLNARAGGLGLTDPDGVVFATTDTLLSVSTAISPTGYITVGDLLAEARRILHGNNLVGNPLADYDLIDSTPQRDYANLVMSALDAFNNSTNIVNA